MTTSIPTQAEYERAETTRHYRAIQDIETAPLSDRQEARADYADAIRKTPTIVGERVGWLLDGSYGKGAYDAARAILERPRMNRVAALGQMIAALEWRCPAAFAREAWVRSTAAERKAVDAAIRGAMDDA